MRLGPVTNTRTTLMIAALAILAVAASTTPVLAQNVGTITRLDGTPAPIATITRAGAPMAGALSMPVQLHDRITTGGNNTLLTISMVGGSSLTLASNSSLSIDDSAMYGTTAAPTKVGLLAGRLHTLISGAMRSASATAFEVHTPNAVGAVRGTEWDERYSELDNPAMVIQGPPPSSNKYPHCKQFTEVWVEEGVVHVNNPLVPGDPGADVHQGQYVKVPCGYIPLFEDAAAAGIGGLDPGEWAALAVIGAGGAAIGAIAATSGQGSSSSTSFR
jgi:hypothetical protein